MIWPIPPNIAAASVKSAGSITSAIIGRYRPAGVPRTGSTEDRAAAYQRLLDAVTTAHSTVYQFRHVQQTVGERKSEAALLPHIGRLFDSGAELLAALGAVRLRGTITVIAAAETLVSEVSDLDMNDKDDEHFGAQFRTVVDAQNAFLNAARADLGYDTRWYQVQRRRRERKFLRRQQETAAIEA